MMIKQHITAAVVAALVSGAGLVSAPFLMRQASPVIAPVATADVYPPLSKQQQDDFAARLKTINPRKLYLACNENRCRALQASLAEAIRSSGTDKIAYDVPRVGLPPGILVMARDPLAHQLAEALSEASGGTLPVTSLVQAWEPQGIAFLTFGTEY